MDFKKNISIIYYTNIYLILGPEKALLIDTGSGLYPIKPVVDNLIEHRELIVINTHTHFDHRGSNDEFETTYNHENECLMKIFENIDFFSLNSKLYCLK